MLGDKRILITGAAGGMGREIAIEAARQGARQVGIVDVNIDGLRETEGMVQAEGGDVCVIQADLRDAASVEAMVQTFVDWAGGLDTLVNNAGVLDSNFVQADEVGVHQLTEEAWDAVMDINLKAVWLGTKFAAPHLLASTRGPSIINAASVSGMSGAGMTAYATSKAGVIQLTRASAVSLAPTVRANSFSPGSIRTPMSDAHLARATDTLATARAMYGSHLIPRRGKVSEIAKTVCFLASDDASFINGTNVPVDGGMMAWRGAKDVELDA